MAVLDLNQQSADFESKRLAGRAAIREYLEIKDRFATSEPRGNEYDRLSSRLRQLPSIYAAALPNFVFSRCPFCDSALSGSFDPWGFDGFWWVPKHRGKVVPPKGCEHFRVLLGAVSLEGQPPITGRFEAQLGPDTPYVIPRLLQLPTMMAVIHSIPMQPGYQAFPIAYFSQEVPPIGSLTQGWVETSYSFQNATGQYDWTVRNDPWDFNLAPWIASGHVRWTIEGNPDALLAPPTGTACPYGPPKPVALPQTAENNTLRFGALPSNETAEPFE